MRAKAPCRRRPNRYRAPTSGAQHSIVRPFVHRLIASCDIYVLPFTTQVKHTMMPAPAENLAFEVEVIFCVQGVASPLWSNIFLNPFDQAMSKAGYRLTRWADDFVVV